MSDAIEVSQVDNKIVGEIRFDPADKKRMVVDCRPHVMSKIRPFFQGITNHLGGKYTHKYISIPITMDTSKDVEMLAFRWKLEIDPKLLTLIGEKSVEYDQIFERIAKIEEKTRLELSAEAALFTLELRAHQVVFNNFIKINRKALLADDIGLGKTYSGLSILSEPDSRPAIIVVPANLTPQWQAQVEKLYGGKLSVHVIPGYKTYPLPAVDIVITSYNRLDKWQDVLFAREGYFKTVIMDEVHELRKTGSQKREHCKRLAEQSLYAVGLSATPIMNYGEETWSVIDAINPGALGSEWDFRSEWCEHSKVRDPHALNSYLISRGLMLRRKKKKDVEPTKEVITMKTDIETLKKADDVAKVLALSILSNKIGVSEEASRNFDYKLRQITGIAKAKPTAEFVRNLVEQGETVLLAGWHKAVYELWKDELSDLGIAFYNGDASVSEKDAIFKSFVDGEIKILAMSLRSGAGLDGLQHVCSTVVFGELDWSPKMMEQLIGRVDREGQTKQVNVFFIVVEDGADPFMMQVLNLKRSQSDGIVDGKVAEGEVLETSGPKTERIRAMAKAFLESLKIEYTEGVQETGLMGRITDLLRKTRVPTNDEDEMQVATQFVLEGMEGVVPSKSIEEEVVSPYKPGSIIVHREYRVGERSRLDFLVESADKSERVAIELKVTSGKREEVYRQVRRYVKEANITSLILYAPWAGVDSFEVDGVPVVVINYANRAL